MTTIQFTKDEIVLLMYALGSATGQLFDPGRNKQSPSFEEIKALAIKIHNAHVDHEE